MQAILQYRNTPDSESGLSPSQVIFGRSLRDVLPFPPRSQVYENPLVRPLWRDIWSQREDSLRLRFGKQVESLSLRTRDLPPLAIGDSCRVQNQTGSSPNKWDRTGVIIQVNDNDQYLVKMHGSGRITLRNRKFLRRIQPYLSDRRCPVPHYTSASPAPTVQGEKDPVHKTKELLLPDPDTDFGSSSPLPQSVTNEPIAPSSGDCPSTIDDSDSSSTHEPNTIAQSPDDRGTVAIQRPSRERRPPPWHSDYKMH